ncbi:exopolysaccharide production protein [Candidatus Photodesmus katoptron]|uniref:O-antigen ligase family protein n=1 Tax=Candidatus Photodesmus anomalopis TaxID=28176 RepID=UPI0004D957F2|nr:exopolysaccharide production protein [Candidatus Photodesmus katoptron]
MNYSFSLKLIIFSTMFFFCFIITTTWYFFPNPIIPIAISLIPLGVIFIFNQPFWLVILFIIFSFFRIHEAIPILYSLKIPLFLSFSSLFSLFWHIFISKKIKLYWHSSLTWLAIFWGLTTIGIFTASNIELAMKMFKDIYWKIIAMTFSVIWLINKEKYIVQILISIIFSGTLIAIITLYNSINEIGLVENTRVTIGRNIGSMLGDPNDLALVLMLPLAFSISLLITKKKTFFVSIIASISSILLILAVMSTQSRGGLLGSISILLFYAIKIIPSKLFLILFGIVSTSFFYFISGIHNRISGGTLEAGIGESVIGRLLAWEAAYKMAIDYPFTGVGLNNFLPNYFFYTSYWDGSNHAVHSTWFGVLAETGMLGFCIFIMFIFSVINTARTTLTNITKKQKSVETTLLVTANAIYAGFIGTIVSSTFLTQGFNWPIYLLSGLTIAISNLIQNSSHNQSHIKK